MTQRFSDAIAAQVVPMSADDWIVRMLLRDGQVVARRVSPGTLTQDEACVKARLSLGPRRADVVDADAWRARDGRRVVIAKSMPEAT